MKISSIFVCMYIVPFLFGLDVLIYVQSVYMLRCVFGVHNFHVMIRDYNSGTFFLSVCQV